jgi:hypothetical protein
VRAVQICGSGWPKLLCSRNIGRPKSCCNFGNLAYAFPASNGRCRSEIGGMSVMPRSLWWQSETR